MSLTPDKFFRTRPNSTNTTFVKYRADETSESGQKTTRRTGVSFWKGSINFPPVRGTLLAELEQADRVGGYFYADLTRQGDDLPTNTQGLFPDPVWLNCRNNVDGLPDRLRFAAGSVPATATEGDIISVRKSRTGTDAFRYPTARIISNIARNFNSEDVVFFETPLPYEFVFYISQGMTRVSACFNRPHVRAKLKSSENTSWTANIRSHHPGPVEWQEDTGGTLAFLEAVLRDPAIIGLPQGDERFFITEDGKSFLVTEDGRFLTTES